MTPIEKDLGPVEAILAYHDRTKHHPEQYARGPGGLDWSNQPDPFRRFTGADRVNLPLTTDDEAVGSGVLFGLVRLPSAAFNLHGLGKLFELSLGLSARKAIAGSSWYLRVNPSSGNLHPTEAYVLLPPVEGVGGRPAMYHYAPREHALEQRAVWPEARPWAGSGFWVGFSSVTWREAWKYGERAFRYCQHDLGHALAALRYAAATLGWQARIASGWTDRQLAHWLGLDRDQDFEGAEREVPELLVRIQVKADGTDPDLPPAVEPIRWTGKATRLSPSPVRWSAIDAAILASERHEPLAKPQRSGETSPACLSTPLAGSFSAEQLIRRRRSAVSFDGAAGLSLEMFLAILDSTVPRPEVPPFDAWLWPVRLHLVLFVHQVEGLPSGLYLWPREPDVVTTLRAVCMQNFEWTPLTAAAGGRALYRLATGEVRDFARAISCGQDIAGDSAFSLGMLANFEPVLRRHGAPAYRELFWEAGMVGQALYLAAEAAGVRGTGIGCYFDDAMHRALGLSDHAWQSLYHFTIGAPVEDSRLQTASPYEHLRRGRMPHTNWGRSMNAFRASS